MRSPKLAALELKRFGRGRLPRAAMAAMLLLPLLYGALYLWSFWDPYERLDRVPVALVNEDRGAKAGGERIDAGDSIVEGLRGSDSFDWHETDAADARKGVEEGRYNLSLTVPADFSERVASSSGDDPRTGALKVRTNDANNYIVGQISRTVFAEVRSRRLHQGLPRLLRQDLRLLLHDARRDGEGRRGRRRTQRRHRQGQGGQGRLKSGLGDAGEGSGELKDGTGRLHDGAGELKKGSRQVADGTQKLADKVDRVAGRAGPFLEENGDEIGATARSVAVRAGAQGQPRQAAGRGPQRADGLTQRGRRARRAYESRCEGPVATGHLLPRAEESGGRGRDGGRRRQGRQHRHPEAGKSRTLGEHLDDLRRNANALAERAPHLGKDLDHAVARSTSSTAARSRSPRAPGSSTAASREPRPAPPGSTGAWGS